jgi:hypothetical protein
MHVLCNTTLRLSPHPPLVTEKPSPIIFVAGGRWRLRTKSYPQRTQALQARAGTLPSYHPYPRSHRRPLHPPPPHHAPSAASPAPTPLICLYGTPSPPSAPTPLQSDGPAAAYMVTQQAFWRQRLQRIDHWEGQQKARLAREAARAARSDGAAKAALILQAGCSLGLLPRVAAWGCSLGLPPGHVGLQPLTRLRRSYCMPYDFAWLYLLWLSCRRPSVLIRSVRRSTPRRRRS